MFLHDGPGERRSIITEGMRPGNAGAEAEAGRKGKRPGAAGGGWRARRPSCAKGARPPRKSGFDAERTLCRPAGSEAAVSPSLPPHLFCHSLRGFLTGFLRILSARRRASRVETGALAVHPSGMPGHSRRRGETGNERKRTKRGARGQPEGGGLYVGARAPPCTSDPAPSAGNCSGRKTSDTIFLPLIRGDVNTPA